MVSMPPTQIYLDRPNSSPTVILKVVNVLLYNGQHTMKAHSVPDDRSESDSTISTAAQINEYSWVASPADNSAMSHQTLKGHHILWGVLSL